MMPSIGSFAAGSTRGFGGLRTFIPLDPITRGVFAGGGDGVTVGTSTNISYFSMQSGGATSTFGTLAVAKGNLAGGIASSSRGIFGGGALVGSPYASDTIEYVTIASTGNATSFGNLTVARDQLATASQHGTRGLFMGGSVVTSGTSYNTIDYITIGSTGNATNFGNLIAATRSGGAMASTTRAVFGRGISGSYTNTLEYVTIATTGNAVSFGNCATGGYSGGVANETRGLLNGYSTQMTEYITIATTGNTANFGDSTTNRYWQEGMNSSTAAIFVGGASISTNAGQNNIDSYTIATTGNATAFGTITTFPRYAIATCSGA
jgi:hypothetical protein